MSIKIYTGFYLENIIKAMDPLQHNGSMAWNY